MPAVASQSLDTRKPLDTRKSLLRSIVVGGLLIGTLDTIIWNWIIVSLIGGHSFISVYQYIASGALGKAAFEGGIPTALLGLFFHFVVSFSVTAVFLLATDRNPHLRRYAIPASLIYGFGVFIVMNMIVTPLSRTPELPDPTTFEVIIAILEHLLVIGLPLGILVQRNARANP